MELSSYTNINKENIIFNQPRDYIVKNSNLSYTRIPIEIKYSKTKKGPLVVETPFLFSFGVTENIDKDSGKLNGYSIPICLWPKDSKPSNSEKEFYDIINLLKDLCNKHLEDKYGVDEIKDLTLPLYYKKIEYTDKKGKKKTKVDETSAPILYTKLIYSDKSKKFLSLFKGKKGENLNPLKYIDFNCRVKLALIIEGIFISDTTTSLQVKVHECYLKELPERKSLMTVKEESDEDE